MEITMSTTEALDANTFADRFTAEVIRLAGRRTFDDGESIETYARETALSYFEDQYRDGMSPEECAEADVGYWGD
jgi:hypothetical protein